MGKGHSQEQRLQDTLAPLARQHSDLRYLSGSYIYTALGQTSDTDQLQL